MLTLKFLIGSGIVAAPHVAIAKTIGRRAVRLYEDATPVRTGRMRASWAYRVQPVLKRGVILYVVNSAPYASFVYGGNRSRFGRIPRRLIAYLRVINRNT